MKEAQDFPKTEFVVSLATVRLLNEYLHHTSWRCEHYDKCSCGLDDLVDSIGLERMPTAERPKSGRRIIFQKTEDEKNE